MSFKAPQTQNAPEPINFTLSGMFTEVRLEQFLNASEGIEVIPSGSSMAFNFEHPLNAELSSAVMSLGNFKETIFVGAKSPVMMLSLLLYD